MLFKGLKQAAEEIERKLEEVEITSVGKSKYQELRNLSFEIEQPDIYIPFESKLSTKFLNLEFEFRLGKSQEAPVHPVTKKQRYEYGDLGKRLQKALRVLSWKRAPMSAIVLILNPEGGSRERGHLPCTIGYNLTIRNGVLETTMLMRSNIFPEMFYSDINLAILVHKHSAEKLKLKAGKLYYTSMRTYRKLKK